MCIYIEAKFAHKYMLHLSALKYLLDIYSQMCTCIHAIYIYRKNHLPIIYTIDRKKYTQITIYEQYFTIQEFCVKIIRHYLRKIHLVIIAMLALKNCKKCKLFI